MAKGARMTEHLGGRAEELTLLCGFLDWSRAVIVHKVEGLATDDAIRVMTPTGLSPLGVVAHLAAVEVAWFHETFVEPRSIRCGTTTGRSGFTRTTPPRRCSPNTEMRARGRANIVARGGVTR